MSHGADGPQSRHLRAGSPPSSIHHGPVPPSHRVTVPVLVPCLAPSLAPNRRVKDEIDLIPISWLFNVTSAC
jgi:hypothetical protein